MGGRKAPFHAFFISALDGDEWPLLHTVPSGADSRLCGLQCQVGRGSEEENADSFRRQLFRQGTSPTKFIIGR